MSKSKKINRTVSRCLTYCLIRLLIITSIALTGCGTIWSLHADAEKEFARGTAFPCSLPRIYAGTMIDIYAVKQNSQIGAMLLWDIPLSLAMDTIVLPATMLLQAYKGNFRGDQARCPDTDLPSPETQKSTISRN
jgi:uncharacterized protein YceK